VYERIRLGYAFTKCGAEQVYGVFGNKVPKEKNFWVCLDGRLRATQDCTRFIFSSSS